MSRFDLGVGLALMPGLLDELERVGDLVDCLEVEPQTFWMETADPRRPFRLVTDGIDELRKRFPTILAHGVTSPVGGSQPPSVDMARLFAESVRRLGAQLASEHLSFNRAAGDDGPFGSAFFLPPRQTEAASRPRSRPSLPSGPSSTCPSRSRRPSATCGPAPTRSPTAPSSPPWPRRPTAASCSTSTTSGPTSATGARRPASSWQLPLERVSEVHLAGGLDRSGYWLDAHSGGLAPELEALAADVLPRCPRCGWWSTRSCPSSSCPMASGPCARCSNASIDSSTPPAGRRRRPLAARSSPHIRGPHTVGDDRPDSPTPTGATPAVNGRGAVAASERPAAWEHVLASLAIGRAPSAAGTVGLRAPPASRAIGCWRSERSCPRSGVALLRELVAPAATGGWRRACRSPSSCCWSRSAESGLEDLLARYPADTTPAFGPRPRAPSSRHGRETTWPTTAPYRLSAIALDLAGIELMRTEHPQTVELDLDPMQLIGAIRSGASVAEVPTGRFLATVG